MAAAAAGLDLADDDAGRFDVTTAGDPVGVELLPSQEYRRERWANRGGWTRHIASAVDTGSNLLWRLSIAEVATDADYSPFPGVQRHQVLLQGAGIALEVDGAPAERVEPPFGQVSFPGDAPAHCRLLDGPVHLFNVFHRPDRFELALWRRPVVGPMYFFPAEGEIWALHLLSGQAMLGSGPHVRHMQQGDTALLGAGGVRPGRVPLDGGGELLVVRFTPRA